MKEARVDYKKIHERIVKYFAQKDDYSNEQLLKEISFLTESGKNDGTKSFQDLKEMLVENKPCILDAISKIKDSENEISILEKILHEKNDNLIYHVLNQHRHPFLIKNVGEPWSLQLVRARYKKLSAKASIKEKLSRVEKDKLPQLEAEFLNMLLTANEGFFGIIGENGKIKEIINNWLLPEAFPKTNEDLQKIGILKEIHQNHPEYIDFLLGKRVIFLTIKEEIFPCLESSLKKLELKAKKHFLETCLYKNAYKDNPTILAKIFLKISDYYYFSLTQDEPGKVFSALQIKKKILDMLTKTVNEMRKKNINDFNVYENTYQIVHKYLYNEYNTQYSLEHIHNAFEKLIDCKDTYHQADRQKLKTLLVDRKEVIFESIAAFFNRLDSNPYPYTKQKIENTNKKIAYLEKIVNTKNNLIYEALKQHRLPNLNTDKKTDSVMSIEKEIQLLKDQYDILQEIDRLKEEKNKEKNDLKIKFLDTIVNPYVDDLYKHDPKILTWLIPELSSDIDKERWEIVQEIKKEHPKFIDYFVNLPCVFNLKHVIQKKLFDNKEFKSIDVTLKKKFLESCLDKNTTSEIILVKLFKQWDTESYAGLTKGIMLNKHDFEIKKSFEKLLREIKASIVPRIFHPGIEYTIQGEKNENFIDKTFEI